MPRVDLPEPSAALRQEGPAAGRLPAAGRERLRRGLRAAAVVATVLFCLLRFVDLTADFPSGVTRSHALYTDEGWYSTAAIRHHLRGDWYLPGDMNNAVAVPGFQLLQAVNFGLLGMDLATARLPGVLLGCGLVALAALLVAREEAGAAVLTALLLAVHVHLFAYSRVALLELPMTFFVLLAVWWLMAAPGREAVRGLTSGLSYAAALATKASALFGLPVLAVVAWTGGREEGGRWTRSVSFSLGLALPLAAFYALVVRRYPEDWDFFWGVVEDQAGEPSPALLARNAWGVAGDLVAADPLLVASLVLAGALVVAGGARWRELRRQPLLTTSLALWLLYAAMLSTSAYRATRYLAPLMVLSILLLGAALACLRRRRRSRAATALAAVMALVAAAQGARTLEHLFHRDHSFARMSREVARRVGEEGVLMGDGALQISLATGIWGVNGTQGTASLAGKLERLAPTHYLQTGPLQAEVREVLKRCCEVELEATYDVFGNYRDGQPVHLYRLAPRRPGSEPPVPGTGGGGATARRGPP